MDYLKTQGISLPKLGLGTFRMQGEACRTAVESALDLGYRHLDTAEMYANEEAIGAALAASSVARKDLHVTTKVWNENQAPDAIRRAFDASLKKLRLDHVDLYLVHWPARTMNLPAMFETLMKLRDEGRTRAQVALKWLLDQDGVAAIPKASRAESQQANLDALKLTLDDADRKAIAALPKNKRCVNPGFAPAWD